ncbi:hypothetical protein Rleg10DRAFT_3636 [Rhizobium leguminosarum bv. trifolii WSM2012]|nr:hypothetical protein Rleg10DRAFT_3636 [Rhizobium leguminosarum bv. trifolii WSM2012]
MAFKIIASQCAQCGTCEFECPSGAISFKNDKFVVDPKTCTECRAEVVGPKCRAICPIPNTCVPA